MLAAHSSNSSLPDVTAWYADKVSPIVCCEGLGSSTMPCVLADEMAQQYRHVQVPTLLPVPVPPSPQHQHVPAIFQRPQRQQQPLEIATTKQFEELGWSAYALLERVRVRFEGEPALFLKFIALMQAAEGRNGKNVLREAALILHGHDDLLLAATNYFIKTDHEQTVIQRKHQDPESQKRQQPRASVHPRFPDSVLMLIGKQRNKYMGDQNMSADEKKELVKLSRRYQAKSQMKKIRAQEKANKAAAGL